MAVTPREPRFKLEDTGNSLKIIIPSKKNWLYIVLYPVWLVLWAAALVFVASTFLGPSGFGTISAFMLLWLTLWVLGGLFVIYILLWQVAGQEIVEASLESLKLKRAVFGLGLTKEYASQHIQDLRVSPGYDEGLLGSWRAARQIGLSGGTIAFDYGARTYRFGTGADETEGKRIVKAILQRYPQYRSRRLVE